MTEQFRKNRIRFRDLEFEPIHIDGSRNLRTLKLDHQRRNIRLIAEEFIKRMGDTGVE